MNAYFAHANINVLNLEKSVLFYKEALSLTVSRRVQPESGDFELVYLADCENRALLELTWLADMKEPYNLGDNESHLAFLVDDFEAAKQLHQEMGVICYENPQMGIYFIEDPDGYWVEIIPKNR